jgi:hypothetical protein
MAYAKPKACYGSCYPVWFYLMHGGLSKRGAGDRAIAQDLSLSLDDEETNGPWWAQMDAKRRQFGIGQGRERHGRSRSYYHFVIAPDPKDFVDLTPEEGLRRVRAIATEWASDYLEGFQWAIVYHDDGANGNIHAHVICNSVNVETGRKYHRTDADWRNWSCKLLDDLCHKYGLHALIDRNPSEDVGAELGARNATRRSRGEREVTAGARPDALQPRYDRSGDRVAPVATGSPAPRRTVTSQPAVRSLAERHMRGRSWKSELRQEIDAAAMDAASFAEFRARMRNDGYDVYQNKAGNLVYVWRDGERKVKDSNLGLMYQNDLLATRFMDLRFSRSGWATSHGEWAKAVESGERIPRLTLKEINEAQAIAMRHHCLDLQDVEAKVAAAREMVRFTTDDVDQIRRARQQLSKDAEDAHLVEGLRDSIEPSRVRGRVVGAPVSEDVLRSYEAARKRLARRRYPTDSESLETSIVELDAKLWTTQAKLQRQEEVVKELMRAERVARAIDAYVDAGVAMERRRYGDRIGEARRANRIATHRRSAAHVPGFGQGAGVPRRRVFDAGRVSDEEQAIVLEREAEIEAERKGDQVRHEPLVGVPEVSTDVDLTADSVQLGPDAVATPDLWERQPEPEPTVERVAEAPEPVQEPVAEVPEPFVEPEPEPEVEEPAETETEQVSEPAVEVPEPEPEPTQVEQEQEQEQQMPPTQEGPEPEPEPVPETQEGQEPTWSEQEQDEDVDHDDWDDWYGWDDEMQQYDDGERG